ncbi:hypothetical protein K450DRAFT_257998 [Umbelopsis ramanniana AG]|uniref:Uncharacterized protein n=1 Tax=Umbelopsis ramanniana AG TaxID=1314678 RepID=A0AAD5E256_UMBRA|nr:uncharacterized protein K450DRAFT_257998 [Umbelopsis ramanniana AG]KAI8576178.1 hypothetical protein K450DRAFT_257998 [Umbelopsis ramanniana AG]
MAPPPFHIFYSYCLIDPFFFFFFYMRSFNLSCCMSTQFFLCAPPYTVIHNFVKNYLRYSC